MTVLGKFIKDILLKRAAESTEEAQELYRKYFSNTALYKCYQAEVDEALKSEGRENIIAE